MDVPFSIILFGSLFTFLHGLEQITGRVNRTTIDYITAIVMADVSLILYNHALLATNYVATYQLPLIFYLTSIFTIGPVNYAYYYSLINKSVKISPRLLIHLLPAFCIFIAELLYYLSPQHFKIKIITLLYSTIINPFSILLFCGGISFVMYQLYFVFQCIIAFRNQHRHTGIYLALILETVNILTPIPVLIWLFTKKGSYYAIAGYMTTTVIITLFLTNRRFPSLFDSIAEAIRSTRYERNYLSHINKEVLHRQLLTLMTQEKIYLDPDVRLDMLAKKLNITHHQLSQFLNEHCNMRFNRFINSYRIEEAKNILILNPDANIIAIAYHVGFNSKSTFNKTFKEFTGQTPSDFKKLVQQNISVTQVSLIR